MPNTQNDNLSVWQEMTTPEFTPLTEDKATEVCIVGTGIAGLITAYLLLKEGYQVLLLDRAKFGQNESGRTAGHLSNILDEGLNYLLRKIGERRAQLAIKSHIKAINLIEKIIIDEQIECDFKRVEGFLYLSPEGEADLLEKEFQAAHKLGLNDVKLLPSPKYFPEFGPALKYPSQARIHSLEFLKGLAKSIIKMGGTIYSKTPVIEFIDGELPSVRTLSGQKVYAKHIISCTHMPINQRLLTHTKESMWRTYMIGVEIPEDVFPDILMWDSAKPYHYLRKIPHFNSKNDLLLVGGEDHKITEDVYAEDKFEKLHDWLLFNLGIAGPLVKKWSGQTIESTDGLAYIGRSPGHRNIYVSSADSGHGLTHGAIAGLLLRDLIEGTPNEWTDLYSPARFHTHSRNKTDTALSHLRKRNHQRKELP